MSKLKWNTYQPSCQTLEIGGVVYDKNEINAKMALIKGNDNIILGHYLIYEFVQDKKCSVIITGQIVSWKQFDNVQIAENYCEKHWESAEC